MGHQLRTYAIVLALLGAVDVAAAQDKPATPPSQSTTAGGLNLNQAQERTVMQGLRGEQTQPTPAGPQAQVGSRVPDSVTPHAMPDNVTAQVPEDRCHLNGLALVGGKPRYVTALGATDSENCWRPTKASGGLRLEDAGDVAATGVDYLAVGALTHSAPVLDIGLDLVRTDSLIDRESER